MKPRLDRLIKRPSTYTTAEETRKPGYLAARFRAIRAQQTEAAREEAQRAVEQAAKVRDITPARRRGAA